MNTARLAHTVLAALVFCFPFFAILTIDVRLTFLLGTIIVWAF
jgi:hypothetical protein